MDSIVDRIFPFVSSILFVLFFTIFDIFIFEILFMTESSIILFDILCDGELLSRTTNRELSGLLLISRYLKALSEGPSLDLL